MKWLPIEEAPKDGREVVGYFPKGYYGDHHPRKGVITWSKIIEGWDDAEGLFRIECSPTHFIHLPEENPCLTP